MAKKFDPEYLHHGVLEDVLGFVSEDTMGIVSDIETMYEMASYDEENDEDIQNIPDVHFDLYCRAGALYHEMMDFRDAIRDVIRWEKEHGSGNKEG